MRVVARSGQRFTCCHRMQLKMPRQCSQQDVLRRCARAACDIPSNTEHARWQRRTSKTAAPAAGRTARSSALILVIDPATLQLYTASGSVL